MTDRTEPPEHSRPPILPADLQELKEQHPSWQLGVIWTTSASGPDRRQVVAIREGVILTAWSAGDLAINICREEVQQAAPPTAS